MAQWVKICIYKTHIIAVISRESRRGTLGTFRHVINEDQKEQGPRTLPWGTPDATWAVELDGHRLGLVVYDHSRNLLSMRAGYRVYRSAQLLEAGGDGRPCQRLWPSPAGSCQFFICRPGS